MGCDYRVNGILVRQPAGDHVDADYRHIGRSVVTGVSTRQNIATRSTRRAQTSAEVSASFYTANSSLSQTAGRYMLPLQEGINLN